MMRKEESLVADIDRQENIRILSQSVSHDDRIENLLARLHIKLNPSMILHQDSVLLPSDHTMRTHLLPHADGHHNREPVSGGKEISIVHER